MFELVYYPKSSSYTSVIPSVKIGFLYGNKLFDEFPNIFFIVQKPLYSKTMMFERVPDPESLSYTLVYIMWQKKNFRILFFYTNFLILFNITKVRKPLYSKILMFKRLSEPNHLRTPKALS